MVRELEIWKNSKTRHSTWSTNWFTPRKLTITELWNYYRILIYSKTRCHSITASHLDRCTLWPCEKLVPHKGLVTCGPSCWVTSEGIVVNLPDVKYPEQFNRILARLWQPIWPEIDHSRKILLFLQQPYIFLTLSG